MSKLPPIQSIILTKHGKTTYNARSLASMWAKVKPPPVATRPSSDDRVVELVIIEAEGDDLEEYQVEIRPIGVEEVVIMAIVPAGTAAAGKGKKRRRSSGGAGGRRSVKVFSFIAAALDAAKKRAEDNAPSPM
jgi:hypothetical protein